MPSTRRRTQWIDTNQNSNVSEGSVGVVNDLDGTLSVADSQGLTLTRMIVDLSTASATIGGAWGIQRLAIGMGMASREAFTAAALPSPESPSEEPARGWVYRTNVLVGQNGDGGAILGPRIMVDIRAQRRLDSGRFFIKMINTDVLGTGFDVRVTGMIRCLFLLP